MRGARRAEAVAHHRGPLDDGPAVRHLAVEETQRIALEAAMAVTTERVEMREAELPQALAVGRAARGVAERVQLDPRPARAHLIEVADEPDEQLGVGQGVVAAEHLGADLIELAIPAALGALTAEHGPCVEEPGLPVAMHQTGFEIGPHDARRRLRTERDRGLFLVPVAEREHLLFDDVRRLANGAREQLGTLEDGEADLSETVAGEEVARRRLEPLPVRALLGKDVPEAPDRGDRAGF